jgi:hypothetical protein
MGVMRRLRESLAHQGARRPGARFALALLALTVLVLPALDLGWNEPRLAERQGTPCPFHANPVVDFCPTAIDVGLTSEPGEIVGPPLRPQLYDASIFIPPKL